MPDAELVHKLGRTVEDVRVRRTKLGIASAEDRRVRWTAERDELVRQLPTAEATWRLRLSRLTVYARWIVLGVGNGEQRG